MIEISRVHESDLHAACSVMREAAEWLMQRGIPLWRPDELVPERMMAHVTREELFWCRVDYEPAGTIILQEKDEFFWPEITDNSSLYFHKLAVRRKFAGQGISTTLIKYACETAKARGKTHVRMDCSAHHPKLRSFYEGHGFRFLNQKQAGAWLVDRLYKQIDSV